MTEPECICANRAEVESMIHPYCPRHAGGDPGPGIGACESCDGLEQPAVAVVGVGTGSATRLCLDCLLGRTLKAEAELAAAREAIKAVSDLISQSHGVDGLHLNGDSAPWSELLAGGAYEGWLGSLSDYLAAHPDASSDGTGRAGGGGHE